MRVRLPKVTRNEALGCDMPALSIVPTGSSIDFLMTPAAERELHVARLGEEIATLAARLHSATYELLVLLREFDACDGWNNGFLSCAHWLHWRTGIDLGAGVGHTVGVVFVRDPLLPRIVRAPWVYRHFAMD